jgi:hypothetical protein
MRQQRTWHRVGPELSRSTRRYRCELLALENRIMKTALALAAVASLALASSPADAKGCLKGAVVGGVAGH